MSLFISCRLVRRSSAFGLVVMAMALMAALSSVAWAEPLAVRVGWGGFYRSGEWTPVYVMLPSDERVTAGSVEVRAWMDARGSVVVRTPLALQPGRSEWIVPGVMGGAVQGMAVNVRDDGGRVRYSRRLETLPLADMTALTTNTRLVVVASPAATTASGGASTSAAGDFVSAFVDIKRLPEWAEMYESLDGLVLTGTTLEDLTRSQCAAIVAWVRAGGRLVVCVPPEGLDVGSPLTEILSARAGELRVFDAGGVAVSGRDLLPRAGADTAGANADPAAIRGVSRVVGLGRVIVSPVPLTGATRDAVGRMLGTMIEAKPRVTMESPRIEPMEGWRGPWGSSAARAQFPWDALALGLIVVGGLLGPVEAVVRRAHDRWPWRWWVVAGVVVLAGGVTLRLIVPVASPPTQRLVLTDQTENGAVATAWAGDAGRTGFLRVIEPMKVRGTDHSATELDFNSGKAAVQSKPAWSLTVGRGMSGEVKVRVGEWNAAGKSAVLTGPVEETLLETSAGVFSGKLDRDVWSFTDSLGPVPPAEINALRRLTPVRSAQLQDRVASGELSLLWIRTAPGEYTRATVRANR